jgi:hypothetical protein
MKPVALIKKVVSLPVGSDGTLRLAAVADTHSRPHPETLTQLARTRPAAIVHAGDI